jgi:urea transporter
MNTLCLCMPLELLIVSVQCACSTDATSATTVPLIILLRAHVRDIASSLAIFRRVVECVASGLFLPHVHLHVQCSGGACGMHAGRPAWQAGKQGGNYPQ